MSNKQPYLADIYLNKSQERVEVNSGLHGAEFFLPLRHHDLPDCIFLHLIKKLTKYDPVLEGLLRVFDTDVQVFRYHLEM